MFRPEPRGMLRLARWLFVVSTVAVTLLEETAAFAVKRASVGDYDRDDHVHRELTEVAALFDGRAVDDSDYEDSLEVENAKRSDQVRDTGKGNRSVQRNVFGAPGQKGTWFDHAQHSVESIEDDDAVLFQYQRRAAAPSQGHHRSSDDSDEQPSWEIPDGFLKKWFGIRWDSAKNQKFTRWSLVDDSMEDLLSRQHGAPLEHIRTTQRSSDTAF